ncbi:hypothetical protein ONZ45_g12974 [Pleurotus djamor]|nr:hypothetical protein ONZ45_g12974 [Pleurotus djamor]
MTSHSILVVGAGPTGLVLAISLALNGVNVRLLEKDAIRKVGQRGAGIQPRTQELHQFLGVGQDIKNVASSLSTIVAYAKGSTVPLKSIDMLKDAYEPTDAFPTTRALVLGQDKQVELLTKRFEALGGKVELGTELLSLVEESDHVAVRLRRRQGEEVVEEEAEFDYVVGADGAHSQIRKHLGLTFLGETKQQRMIIGDIYIRTPLSREWWHMWGDMATSFLSLRPVHETPGLFFVIITGTQDNDALLVDHEAFVNRMREISGMPDLDCGELAYVAPYTPNMRMVDSFGKGRIFVAGDAAHVHSPAGGQGMNSGAQDAMNLGWKLALACKGIAAPNLLDSYTAERLPVIAEMLQITTKLHGVTLKEGALSDNAWKRGGSLDQLGVNYRGTQFVLDEIEGRTLGPWNHYEQRLSGSLVAGDRAPDASGLVPLSAQGNVTSDATQLFDIFSATKHTILIFPRAGDHSTVASVAELLGPLPEGLFTLNTIVSPSHQDSVEHGARMRPVLLPSALMQ